MTSNMGNKTVLVLGGGPGGYAAAFLAADRGMNVTLVDSGHKPGGVCLHRGCIPSKALLHLAKLIHETREAKEWGIAFGEPQIDIVRMREWKNQVVDKMASGLVTLCKQRGVKFVTGHGVFQDSNTILVSDKDKVKFDHCILAVGSRPILPEMFKKIEPPVLDSTSALEVEEIPKKTLVVGGGYIGLEVGTVYAALGSNVTVVEMMDSLLPGVDTDLVRPLQLKLKKQFEKILLKTRVACIEKKNSGFKAFLKGAVSEKEHMFDQILVAVGRQPNSKGIGLENTQVKTDENGFVEIDHKQRTTDSSIFAIGDVVGGAMLAHKATAEARVAVEVIAGKEEAFDHRAIPAVVFTDPEIAWAGLTETDARKINREIKIAKFPWGASGRAQTLGRPDGQTKLILDPETGQILGMGLVGSGAGELIGEGVLAIEMGALAEDLAFSIHPHPTLSETLMEAADVYLGKSLHVYQNLSRRAED